MNLIYEIIDRNLVDHTIGVRYTTDKVSAEMLEPQLEADGTIKRNANGGVARCRGDFNIIVPVPEPDAAGLQKLILAHAPLRWLATREAVLDPKIDTSMSAATALMEQPVAVDPTLLPLEFQSV